MLCIRKLKIDSIFIGRLGSDDFGKKFISQFDQLGVNLDFLQLDNDSSTRVVNVDRDQFGDRFFQDSRKVLKHVLQTKFLVIN